jgi:hypothetical protein
VSIIAAIGPIIDHGRRPILAGSFILCVICVMLLSPELRQASVLKSFRIGPYIYWPVLATDKFDTVQALRAGGIRLLSSFK